MSVLSRITKIFKITKDLEHNNYAHITNGLRIVTLASHAFLTQDVVSPPPSLLSRNIDVYLSQVHTPADTHAHVPNAHTWGCTHADAHMHA